MLRLARTLSFVRKREQQLHSRLLSDHLSVKRIWLIMTVLNHARFSLLFCGLLFGCKEQVDDPFACDHTLTQPSTSTGPGGASFVGYDPEECVPDEVTWDTLIEPLVNESCGTCHGSEPSFGAPVSLTDYDALLVGEPGDRVVDRMALRVASHTMPPPNSPQLSHADLDNLVEWSTCGHVHPDESYALSVDREPYGPEVPENLELPSLDLLASGFSIGRETLDRYQCFAFDLPIDGDRFLKRIQVSLDESRVLHHVVVAHDPERVSAGESTFECSDWPLRNTPYLWAWAPGGGAFDFEEGGLRLKPSDRIVVQIHYNNGAGLEDVNDKSGIRIFHGPVVGREWTLIDPGATDFEVPVGDSVACGSTGRVRGTLRVLAAFPHMHVLGQELHTLIEHKDGSASSLIHLTGWNFEAQRYYAIDEVLKPGDRLHTWCGYRNETGRPTQYGLNTDEEMCFNFLYVSEE